MSTAPAPAGRAEPRVRAVLDTWFGAPGEPGFGRARPEWFRGDPGFDAALRGRFGALVEAALDGGFAHWSRDPEGGLALLLLLDQFTRNGWRGTPGAFAGDARAQQVARRMVDAGHDRALRPVQRWFVYLPFEHAESLPLQDEAVRLFAGLEGDPDAGGAVVWAERHRAVIRRFGRFPHRNAILGRRSTPKELAFLREPGSRF